jgi:hypothetical protein
VSARSLLVSSDNVLVEGIPDQLAFLYIFLSFCASRGRLRSLGEDVVRVNMVLRRRPTWVMHMKRRTNGAKKISPKKVAHHWADVHPAQEPAIRAPAGTYRGLWRALEGAVDSVLGVERIVGAFASFAPRQILSNSVLWLRVGSLELTVLSTALAICPSSVNRAWSPSDSVHPSSGCLSATNSGRRGMWPANLSVRFCSSPSGQFFRPQRLNIFSFLQHLTYITPSAQPAQVEVYTI